MKKDGFTLVELLIGSTLAIVVMIVIMNVSTMMARMNLQSIHKGEVNGETLATLNAMDKDIQGATFLFLPTDASPTGDVVGGCTNWSSQAAGNNVGGKLDPNSPVTYFMYCIDAARFGNLQRYTGTIANCQGGVSLPSGCGNADSKGGAASMWVSGNATTFGLSRADNLGYYFARARDSNGVELHYILGNSTPTADASGAPGHAAPHYYKIDTNVRMIKSYNVNQD